MSVAEIQPRKLSQLLQQNKQLDLIDVRQPGEFSNVHAVGAKNYPLDQLNPDAVMNSRTSTEQPLYVICQMGGRSRKACEQFIAAGFRDVVNVAGGTSLWQSQGLPVVRAEKQVMAMDRQVRVAAGFLIAVGSALAATESLRWVGIGLAAFVGLGLCYSGATNTCGMATVLGFMPWNRPAKSC